MSNISVKLKNDLTYKNIFGKEKKIVSKGFYVDLEGFLVKVSFRGEEYLVPINNIVVTKEMLDKLEEGIK